MCFGGSEALKVVKVLKGVEVVVRWLLGGPDSRPQCLIYWFCLIVDRSGVNHSTTRTPPSPF